MSEPDGIELSMGEGHGELRVASTEGPPAWTLDALAHAAWQLEPPAPHEKKAVLRPEAAHLVDSHEPTEAKRPAVRVQRATDDGRVVVPEILDLS